MKAPVKQFTYTIKRQPGIHARPASLLAMLIKEYKDTTITVAKGEKLSNGELLNLMSLDTRLGDEVIVTADGFAEEAAIEALKVFFQENL